MWRSLCCYFCSSTRWNSFSEKIHLTEELVREEREPDRRHPLFWKQVSYLPLKMIRLLWEMYQSWCLGETLTVFRVPFACENLPSVEMNLERSLKTHSSKSTVFPLPVGAEMTIFASEWKQIGKHSLWSELKYLGIQFMKTNI